MFLLWNGSVGNQDMHGSLIGQLSVQFSVSTVDQQA